MKVEFTAAEARRRVVTAARAEVGYTEEPPGSNRTKFWAQTASWGQGQPWCGAFVTDITQQATGVLVKGFNSFYTPSIIRWAQKVGAWKTSDPQPGDWCLMNFPGGEFTDHVGIVEKGLTNIEGNTSSGNAGSQNNGGGVYRRTRNRSLINGWVDLVKMCEALGVEFAPTPPSQWAVLRLGSAGQSVRFLQEVLREDWRSQIAVDGEFGPRTQAVVRNFQRVVMGEKHPDGEVGPKTWPAVMSKRIKGWKK